MENTPENVSLLAQDIALIIETNKNLVIENTRLKNEIVDLKYIVEELEKKSPRLPNN